MVLLQIEQHGLNSAAAALPLVRAPTAKELGRQVAVGTHTYARVYHLIQAVHKGPEV
jgi:hypothetical protein